jgi:putative sterol carrier protein
MKYASADEFFSALEARSGDSRARGVAGSYRFDIDGAGSWHVDVRDGAVEVARSDEPADCIIRTDEKTFLGIVSREKSPVGAFMTGKIRVEGDIGLALKLRDVLA